jgi:hypothetical protein
MIYDRFASALNTIPLLAPQDTAATALTTPYVKLGGAHGGTLFVQFGSLTAATAADQPVVVTLLAATVQAGTSASAVTFNYRLSGAIGANSWGAITAATTAGVSVSADTGDNKMVAIDIDPSDILRQKADAIYVAAVVTPDAGATASLVNAFVQLEPRVSQATMVSAT